MDHWGWGDHLVRLSMSQVQWEYIAINVEGAPGTIAPTTQTTQKTINTDSDISVTTITVRLIDRSMTLTIFVLIGVILIDRLRQSKQGEKQISLINLVLKKMDKDVLIEIDIEYLLGSLLYFYKKNVKESDIILVDFHNDYLSSDAFGWNYSRPKFIHRSY